MKTGLVGALAGAFLVALISLIATYLQFQPRILLLYSYKADSPWVKLEDAGFSAELAKSRERPRIRRHYLGVDGSWAKRSLSVVVQEALRSAVEFRPDVVIAMDDEARAFVAHELSHDSSMNIVFGGVHEDRNNHEFFQRKNVTGVFELIPLAATRDLFDQLRGGEPLRVCILGDGSPSGIAVAGQLASYEWNQHAIVQNTQAADFDSWKEVLATHKDADIVFLTSYHLLRRDRASPEIVPAREAVAWAREHSSSLLLSDSVDFIADGGALSLVTSPKAQAQAVAGLALAIIGGATPSELPMQASDTFMVLMSKSRLAADGINLPPIYEAAAISAGTLYP